MKKLFTLLFFLSLFGTSRAQTGTWTDEGNYDTSWYDGNNNPVYHISTPQHLAGLAYLASNGQTFLHCKIVLDQDLDMSAHYWTPIKEFAGFLNGEGHKLSGLNIDANSVNAGFIAKLTGYSGYENSGVIYNLTLDNTCKIQESETPANFNIGGFAGITTANATIANCRFEGLMEFDKCSGEIAVGGIAGRMEGTVTGCRNDGSITINMTSDGEADCGGIAGMCNGKNIRITNCFNTGELRGSTTSDQSQGISIAGIVGSNFSGSTLNNCLNQGNIYAHYTTSTSTSISIMSAGIVASNYGLVINCGNNGSVSCISSQKARSGGICASNSGTIMNSYNTASVICNGKKGSASYNNGGGIVGIHQYSSIGLRPMILGCYNIGKVTSTGSEEKIGSIVGDASYFIDEKEPKPEVLASFMSTETGKAIGYDYHNQAPNVIGIFPAYLTDPSTLDKLNNIAQAYNDTTTTDWAQPLWKGEKDVFTHFRQTDAFCTGTDFYTADFCLTSPNEQTTTEGLSLRYGKTGENDFKEIAWGTLSTLQIETLPDTEYEYYLVIKEGAAEVRMPVQTLKTGYIFQELSTNPTRTTARVRTLLAGDRTRVKKISFEVSLPDTPSGNYTVVSVTEGEPMDDLGFVNATVTGLNALTTYAVRAIVETDNGTIYSKYQNFTTKNTGVYGKTLEQQITQTTMTFKHTLITDKIEGTLKESGCCYLSADILDQNPAYWTDLTQWTKVKGEPSTYNQETNVFQTQIKGLKENGRYAVKHYVIVEIPGEGEIMEAFFTSYADILPTLSVTPSWQLKQVTQSTAVIECTFDTGDAQVIETGLEMDGTKYKLKGNETTLTLTGLIPGWSYHPVAYIETANGYYTSPFAYFSTENIHVYGEADEIGQTSALISVSSDMGDASAEKEGVEWTIGNETFRLEGNPVRITGLPAYSGVSYRTFVVIDNFYTYSEWKTLQTLPISVTIDKADAVSNTSATLHAHTECDTYSDAIFGFEWRKYDAPDLVPSEEVIAQKPSKGQLAFSLRGLSPNTYYKYRAFIRYQDREYFSEWIAFGTADSFVLFPPSVQTITITSPDGNSVTLLGYIIAGSEEILQKGFEYWIDDVSKGSSEKQVIIVDGEEMSAELHDLKPYTAYRYRSFAKTASGTTYGDEQAFTTGGASSITTGEIEGFTARLTQNPVRESSRLIVGNTQEGTVTYRVYSLKGTLVRQEEVPAQNGTTEIPIHAHHYADGMYVIQVNYKDMQTTLKMLVP